MIHQEGVDWIEDHRRREFEKSHWSPSEIAAFRAALGHMTPGCSVSMPATEVVILLDELAAMRERWLKTDVDMMTAYRRESNATDWLRKITGIQCNSWSLDEQLKDYFTSTEPDRRPAASVEEARAREVVAKS